ncbi:MAG: hypothetical protein JSW55_06525 [Chloroflexota bacterium]|nr:MAG: hypothetical protein JSW55_06525 [Chloroflexota bacterium]
MVFLLDIFTRKWKIPYLARRHVARYLEFVIRIGHYAQLIRALAAVAYYLAHFGDKQQALAVWQQLSGQLYIEASKWYADVIGREIKARTASISPPPTAETAVMIFG